MLDKQTAMQRLMAARDVFWFSVGAYALLTEEPSKSELGNFQIRVTERNKIEVSRSADPAIDGTGYTIGFNAGLDRASALRVVDYACRQMLLDSFEIAKEFAKDNSLPIMAEPWYEFAYHYRNGVAHNGAWHFTARSLKRLPVTWRSRTITAELQGAPLNGFLSWFEGMQLGAQISNFVHLSKPVRSATVDTAAPMFAHCRESTRR